MTAGEQAWSSLGKNPSKPKCDWAISRIRKHTTPVRKTVKKTVVMREYQLEGSDQAEGSFQAVWSGTFVLGHKRFHKHRKIQRLWSNGILLPVTSGRCNSFFDSALSTSYVDVEEFFFFWNVGEGFHFFFQLKQFLINEINGKFSKSWWCCSSLSTNEVSSVSFHQRWECFTSFFISL